MLGEIYAPSEYESKDADPSKTPEEKLEIISKSKTLVIPNKWRGIFKVTLPFVQGATAEIFEKDPNSSRDPNVLFLHDLNVGDKELYGRGIGSRLVKATIKYAATQKPELTGIRAVNADLGLVNTVVKAVGSENVRVSLSAHEHFGMDAKAPLEEIFMHQAPAEGSPYKIWEVNAHIEPKTIEEWELPVNQSRKNKQK
jgi:hypothetical protein